MRSGRKALVEHWKRQRNEDMNHVALNMKPLRRTFVNAVAELAEHVELVLGESDLRQNAEHTSRFRS